MTIMSLIEGLNQEIVIEIDDNTGAWTKFIKKDKGNRDSLQDCWEKMLDANTKLTATKRTTLKQRRIDQPRPTR